MLIVLSIFTDMANASEENWDETPVNNYAECCKEQRDMKLVAIARERMRKRLSQTGKRKKTIQWCMTVQGVNVQKLYEELYGPVY